MVEIQYVRAVDATEEVTVPLHFKTYPAKFVLNHFITDLVQFRPALFITEQWLPD